MVSKPVKKNSKAAGKKPGKKAAAKATSPKKAKSSPKQTTQPKKTAKLKTPPSSMEELLAQTQYTLHTYKKGDSAQAILTDKGRKNAYFDIGSKTEGVISGREAEYVEDYLDRLKIGDVVEARIVTPENEKGQILLSLRDAANDWKWGLLQEKYDSEEKVEVRGLDVNRGGMIARIMGIRGFIPSSQFGHQWTGKLELLHNKLFPVKIIEIDREKNRLIFSEKAISEEAVLKQQGEAVKQVKVGKEYEGEISGVMPFGLFVRIPVEVSLKQADAEPTSAKKGTILLDGLVHISQVSWEKVDDLKKLYQVGEKVKVKVIDVDEKSGKLNLSIKQLQPDPWMKLDKKYTKDKKVKGEITRLAPFGAFVQLEPGVEGLIHISKIPAEKEMAVGDKVEVYIESIDLEQRRISLGLVLSAKPVGYK
jgi:ribosomal protein S1